MYQRCLIKLTITMNTTAVFTSTLLSHWRDHSCVGIITFREPFGDSHRQIARALLTFPWSSGSLENSAMATIIIASIAPSASHVDIIAAVIMLVCVCLIALCGALVIVMRIRPCCSSTCTGSFV
jgi:hypothetical protein